MSRQVSVPVVLQSKEGQWVVLGLVALVVVYYVGKQLLGAAGKAAGAAGGLLSGNNALTQGTDYQGAGVAGTLGAAANSVSGGSLDSAGNSLGGWLYGLFNPAYDPNAPAGPTASAATRDQVVTPNYIPDISSATGGPNADLGGPNFGITDPGSGWD